MILSISIVTFGDDFGYNFDNHMKDRVSIRDSVAFKAKKSEWYTLSNKEANETSYWDILNGYNNKLLSASDSLVTRGAPFTIQFGTYKQNINEEPMPIRWVILEKKKGMALLMSLRMLDYRSLMDKKEEKKDNVAIESLIRRYKDRYKYMNKDEMDKVINEEIKELDEKIENMSKELENDLLFGTKKEAKLKAQLQVSKKRKTALEELKNGKITLDDNLTTDDSVVKWEDCDLRKWLNKDFYNSAFSATEKNRIKALSTKNGKDKVFLLTNKEKINYLNTSATKDYNDCGPWDASNWTEYSYELYNNDENKDWYAYYWLRNGVASFAKNVPVKNQPNEKINDNYKKFGVRPCIWIVYDENAVSANSDFWDKVLRSALEIGIDYAIDKYLP